MLELDKQKVEMILAEIHNLSILMKGKDRKDLEENLGLERSITMTMTIIGEDAGKISKELRDAHPEIAWRKIINLRNRIVHNYRALDFDLIYKILKEWMPDLKEKLQQIVAAEIKVKQPLFPKKRERKYPG